MGQFRAAVVERSDTSAIVGQDVDTTTVGFQLASCHGTLFANGPVAWVEER
jgi:hypothetical protein